MRLLQPVKISGWDLNGKVAKMEVKPADPGAGIVFKLTDDRGPGTDDRVPSPVFRLRSSVSSHRSIKAAVANARVIGNCTSLKSGRGMVMMVEHFLAACYAIGLFDLIVDIQGRMLPFGDGSAQPFVRAFLRAGLVRTNGQEPLKPRRPIGVKDGKGFILLIPREKLRIHCFIDYPHLGRQFFSGCITRKLFCEEIAPARTFGPPPPHLKQRLGFRLKRVQTWAFPKTPRFNNEPCRHKVLDLLGDLTLLGRPLQAEILAFNPGHRLNLTLVKRLKEMGA